MSRVVKKPSIVGRLNPNWRGGKIVNKGRVLLYRPEHPNSNAQGYIARARLVCERKIGRRLRRNEIAHHRNRNTMDDKPRNLEVMTVLRHNRLHAKELQHLGKWSRNHDRCVECKTTEAKHKSKGKCTRCYDKARWPRRPKHYAN